MCTQGIAEKGFVDISPELWGEMGKDIQTIHTQNSWLSAIRATRLAGHF